MCTWMSSDNDFFVLRRFGKVGARVLLYMQDQIVELEEELRKQDDFCKSAPKELADSGTFRGDQNSKRRDIMRDLSVMLDRYRNNSQFQAESLSQARKLTTQQKDSYWITRDLNLVRMRRSFRSKM